MVAATVARHSKLFIDSNNDGKVTPGDTLVTFIDITNPNATSITNVLVNDTLTSGTTYVAGTTVITTSDAYALTGNTPISYGAAQGLLANDSHFDGNNAGTNTGLTVAQVNGGAIGSSILIHDSTTFATIAGTLNIAADGSFTFTPTTGYNGTGAFNYDISDGTGLVGHQTVSLVVTGYTWYVQGGAGTNGDGSYGNPFNNLASVSTVDHTGDTVVLHGTTSTSSAFVMKAGEILYGDGSTYSTNGHAITTGSATDSAINHSAGGITLASGNTIDGVDLVGITNNTATGITDGNGTVGTLTINHMAISGQGQILDIDQGGVLNVTLKSIASTGFNTAGQGGALDLQGVSGSFTVSGTTSIDASAVSATQASGGINVNAASLTATFTGAASVSTGASNAVTLGGGTESFSGGATLTTTSGAGLTTTGGTLSIASGSISTTTGHVVDMTNTTVGTVALSSLTDSSAVVGSAVKFDNVDGGTFGATTVNVAGASGDGLHIGTGSSTAFTFGNTTVTGITGGNQGIDISGNTTAAGAANVTFNGTVSVDTHLTAAAGAVIDNNNGTVAFTGTSVTVNSGAGNAVTISNNGAAVSFTGGGLNVDTTSGTAFSATQGTGTGGTLNISAGPGPVNTNSIVSTTGRAVNIDSVTSTVDLHDVSAGGGGTTAIFLRNTGGSGHFIVSGTGTTAASGGIIHDISGGDGSLGGQATVGTGVYLENVSNITLDNMNFTGTFTNFGIRGESVNGFTLQDSNLTGTFGTSNALDEGAIRFGTQSVSTGLTGTVLLSGDVIQGGQNHNFADYTYGSGTLTMTVQDSAAHQAAFNANNAASGGNDLLVETGGTSHLNFTSTAVDYNGSHDTNLDIVSLAQTVQSISIQNNNFLNTEAQTGGAANIRISGSLAGGTVNYTINNNILKGANGSNIFGSFNGTSGTVTGHITNNTTGTPANNVYDSTLANTGSLNGGLFFGGIDSKQAGSGTYKYDLNISNNIIADHNSVAGAIVIRSSNDTNSGTERVEATINANTFEQGGPNMNTGNTGAIYLQPAGSSTSAFGTIGANITNNIFNMTGNSTAGGLSGLIMEDISNANGTVYLPGIATTSDTNVMSSYLISKGNTFTNTNPNVADYLGNPTVTGTALQDPVPLIALPPSGQGWQDLLPAEKPVGDPVVTVTDPGDTGGSPGGTTGGTTGGGTGGGTTPPADTPPVPAPTEITDNLTQEALDQMVVAAIHRWEVAGATAEQLAAMRAVSVTVSNMGGFQVGDSVPGHIVVSANGAGYGWFVDATPDDDAEFTGTGTDLHAAAGSAALGHIDLLTVIEHELGHQIGLDDLYLPAATADIMYGFVDPSERRLPTSADAAAATGTAVDHEAFALSPVTIGAIPNGSSVEISFQATVNNFSAGLAPTLSGTSTVSYTELVGPSLTASESINKTTDTMTNSAGTVTTQPLAVGSLTLGDTVFKDANGNHTYDSGEGISGVQLSLFVKGTSAGQFTGGSDADVDGDGINDQFVSTVTSVANGAYSFTGLAPGDYMVRADAINFTSGHVLNGLKAIPGAVDPDDNVDNDSNAVAGAGGTAYSLPITLAYDTEPTAGAGNDTNNTLDIGLQANQAPAGTDAATTINEDSTYTFASTDFGFSDSDGNSLLAVKFTTLAANGTLKYDADGAGGNPPVAVTVGQVISAADIDLGKVTFVPAANANGSGYGNFTFQVQDNGGTANGGVDLDQSANAFVINVTAVNDAPVNTVPAAAQTLAEDGSKTFSTGNSNAISVADADVGAGNLTVTVSVDHGALSLSGIAGLSFTTGDGTADSTMTFSGTASAINTALNGLVYAPTANYNGADLLTITTNDNGNTGTPGALQDTDTVSITVTSVNDAPTVTDESATTDDATNYVFGSGDFTAHFSDANDSPADAAANVIITSLPATGTLIYDGTPIAAGSLPFTISVANLDAGKLVYDPAAASGGSDYTFGFEVQDDGGTTGGGQDTSAAQTFTMHVVVSQAPPVVDLDSTAPGTGTSVTFNEQTNIQVAPNATVTDSDSANFDTGTLTVAYQSGGTASDYFNAQDEGGAMVANGHIGISGTDVYYNLVKIGTITSQGPGNPYVVTFNANATPTAVEALVRDIHAGNIADNPPSAARTANFTVTDGDGGSTTVAADITITPINDPPSGGAATATFDEDTVLVLTSVHFTQGYSDPDGDPFNGIKVSSLPASGTLMFDADGPGGSPAAAVSVGDIISKADIDAGKLTYTPATDVNGDPAAQFDFLVIDNSGAANDTATNPATLFLSINAINDAPVLSSTGPVTTDEQTAVTLASSITVADVELDAFNGGAGDYAGATLRAANNNGDQATDQFTIVDGAHFTVSGSNLVDDSSNVFATFTGGNGTQLVITFTSSQTPATTALVQDVAQHIQYTSTSDAPPASVDVVIVLNDGDFTLNNQGAEPNNSFLDSIATDVFTVNITAVNDAPVNSLGGTIGTGEDAIQAWLSGMSVSDVDAGSNPIQVTFHVDHGTLDIDTSVAGGITAGEITFQDANTITVQASQSEINATLAATNGLTYSPDHDFNGDDTLTVTTDDLGNSGTGGAMQAVDTRTISVSAVDDPPVAQPDAVSTAENAVLNGSVFTDNGSGPDYDVDGPPIQVSEVNGSAADVGVQITLASGAKLTLNADGTYSYDPNGKFNQLTHAGDPGDQAGAVNTSATDTFQYTLAGGNTVTVTVTVNGVASADDRLLGDSGDNNITGTADGDFFMLQQGGDDTATGLGGADVFYFGAAFTAADAVDGGDGKDILAIQGDYSGGLTLGAHGLDNVETLSLLTHGDNRFGGGGASPYSYDITTVDANVAAGHQLIVNGAQLVAGEDLTFDGSAESDGTFLIYAGMGIDHLTGGANTDIFFFAEGRYNGGDIVHGGGGNDIMVLRGDYAGANAVTFAADAFDSVETVTLMSAANTRFFGGGTRYSYDITTDDANVAAGATMTVNAGGLVVGETLTFDGSAETNGHFRIFGGADTDTITGGHGDDLIYGGLGADTLNGGGGNDVFRYQSAAESVSGSEDHIQDFTTGDRIDLSRIDADGNDTNGDTAFTFVNGGAFTHHAGELIATNSGNVWTVSADVDGDGVADFQLIVVSADNHAITASDFMV